MVIISCAVEAVPEERFNPIVDVVRQVKARELLKNSIVSDTVKSFGEISSYNDDKRIVLKEGGVKLIGVLLKMINDLATVFSVNGLLCPPRQLPNDLTFRQKKNIWISELDHCYVTPRLLAHIRDFRIKSRVDLPSAHAPISVTLAIDKLKHTTYVFEGLRDRAGQLGDYTAWYHHSRSYCQIK